MVIVVAVAVATIAVGAGGDDGSGGGTVVQGSRTWTRSLDLLSGYRERGRGVGHGLAAHGGRHDGERRLRTNCWGLRGIGRVGSAPEGIVLHRRW